MALTRPDAGPRRALEHPALIYRTLEGFLEVVVPFVEDGMTAGEPVFAAVGPDELRGLRDALGDPLTRGTSVHLADTNEWHPEPAPRLRAFHRHVTDTLRSGATRIRLVGEPLWPRDAPELSLEWARYESVLNVVLAPFPVELICTYDASRLDPEVVANARLTHPAVTAGGRSEPSREFVDPATLLTRWNPALNEVPASAETMPEPLDAAAARSFVAERARRAGLATGRSLDLALAISEVLVNAATHGGGAVSLRTWAGAGHVACQVDDRGPGVRDPLAGYRPPDAGAGSGRGLWLARQVVDLMRIVPGPNGTSVRLQIRL